MSRPKRPEVVLRSGGQVLVLGMDVDPSTMSIYRARGVKFVRSDWVEVTEQIPPDIGFIWAHEDLELKLRKKFAKDLRRGRDVRFTRSLPALVSFLESYYPEISKGRPELAYAVTRDQSAEHVDLRRHLGQMETKLEQARADLKRIENEKDLQRAEVARLSDETQRLRTKALEASSQNTKLKGEITQLHMQLSQLRIQLSSSQKDYSTALELIERQKKRKRRSHGPQLKAVASR